MAENRDRSSIEGLPLVLAGPILRRTEATSVTVWLALRQAQTVTLKVCEAQDQKLGATLWETSASTLQLGQHLHLLAITATPTTTATSAASVVLPSQSRQSLQPGKLYAYDLSFQDANGCNLDFIEAMRSPAWPSVTVSYFEHGRPTFSLPPADLEQLQIFHGSCRKVHDRGYDALPILDLAIEHRAALPNQRPHQLFLTGDQIYGDEVADPLLWAIEQIRHRLFGWNDPLALHAGERDCELDKAEPVELLSPGQRSPLAEAAAGLTAGLKNTPEKAASHLFSFQEYCLTYLLSWSDWGWGLDFPTATAQGLQGNSARRWDEAVEDLKKLARSQPHVRRALANIPTYMIFDDHEVSDDWNLNQAWCERVYSKPLGRQIVRNALLAYALFQGWGNTPTQFEPGSVGAELLHQTKLWVNAQGKAPDCTNRIYQLLGLPKFDSQGRPRFVADGKHNQRLHSSAQKLSWHYKITSACHEVIVLDSRTQRGYPNQEDAKAIPQLLSNFAFKHQLQPMLAPAEPLETEANKRDESSSPPNRLTFVVAPTNVFGLKLLDQAQRLAKKLNRVFDADVGDSWNLEEATRAKLLSLLLSDRDRIVILSGDIHFSGTIHVNYSESGQRSKSLVQLTASAFCNSDSITGFLQTKLKSFFPESERYWQANGAHYRTRWIQRQPARKPAWPCVAPWMIDSEGRAQSHHRLQGGLAQLWYSRWLQEGREVVGFNNIGQVELTHQYGQLSVIHKVHWYAPWKLGEMVCTRFWTQLSQ